MAAQGERSQQLLQEKGKLAATLDRLQQHEATLQKQAQALRDEANSMQTGSGAAAHGPAGHVHP
jgi:flagellar biosynthesis/type III secretory pathway chaperone